MSGKRYCLDKLIKYDPVARLEVWKTTKYCSDEAESLESFLAENYRIYDTVENKEVKRNVNFDAL